MGSEDLHQTLARLRAELRDASSLDDESRRLLHEVTRDAERFSGKSARQPHGWVERLEELAVRFEAEHPRLGASLRELVEILGKAGV
jgi:hypothetical protein